MQFLLLVILVLAVLLVVFALQNAAQVEINFFVWEMESSLALILLVCVVLGAILGALFSIPGVWKRNAKIRSLKADVKTLEQELQAKAGQEAAPNLTANELSAPQAVEETDRQATLPDKTTGA